MPELESPESGSDNGRGLDALERAREAFSRRAWAAAYSAFESAERSAPLDACDLERLATCAYLLGRDAEYLKTLERAYHAHLSAKERARASRAAFWVSLHLLLRAEPAQARGWLGRAQRCLDTEAPDCLEHGYLLLPRIEEQLGAMHYEAAGAAAARAIEIAQRFGDQDLIAFARHLQGRLQVLQGEVLRGLAVLDEVMVSATAGELSPITTGLLYCSVIESCHSVYALDRAHEWTRALAAWCDEQPDVVAFSGVCRVHRAEILQLHGAWPEAVAEARRACERCRLVSERASAAAYYQEAEVHRLRGDFNAAEDAYRQASQLGWEPQPGLALLRLAQGRRDVAAAAIRRVLDASADSLARTRLLPAYVEIMLAEGDLAAARAGSDELGRVASGLASSVMDAMAAQAAGTVDLADGKARAAAIALQHAAQLWQQVGMPYAAACARACHGLACRALGDAEGAQLELEAARIVFERLGAAPDVQRISGLLSGTLPASQCLTPREVEVLRLVAAGESNKAIARALFVSEKTVERHLSNIFCKLDVRSRTAAAAYAYEHKLVTPT